ncbi:MAG: response regulator transcription factor [Chloroflexi bacterium]|nr:response regulator transcription factor [Chloroflexota bacterium]MBV9598009.1 response regulator transcription factor [Chloroflexota bacterium]
MRVLVVEDEPMLLDLTAYALRKFGFDSDGVTDGAAALERWESGNYDLVVLDVMLPSASGLEVCREIRKRSESTPIIIVSALSQEDEIVAGFESGASDYVTKPVSYRVLAMRMRNLLQRRNGREVVDSSLVARSGDISVDMEAYEVHNAGQPVRMTRLETRILFFLVSNAGRVLTTDRLIELAWEYEGGDAFSLKTHISHIRQKLGIAKGEPGYVSSAPHIGYRLERGAQNLPGVAGLAA